MRIPAGVLAVLMASINATCAGEIVGKASRYFCEMIVVTCQTNMNSCPPVFSGQIFPGQTVVSDTGQLCYRRSKTPSDCNSGLTPDWICDVNTSPEPRNFSIE
ncbi:MAG: hypothetical protein QOF19_3077 [Alphaproteobacteria bacterium]|nr:hypothetical protein [Alphaproteobacteria bacterium]